MAEQSLAATTTRVERGIRLFAERRHEITRIKAHSYRVPSCSGDDAYLVQTDLRSCSCPDHETAKSQGERCKHVHAALLVLEHRRELRRMARRERSKTA